MITIFLFILILLVRSLQLFASLARSFGNFFNSVSKVKLAIIINIRATFYNLPCKLNSLINIFCLFLANNDRQFRLIEYLIRNLIFYSDLLI